MKLKVTARYGVWFPKGHSVVVDVGHLRRAFCFS